MNIREIRILSDAADDLERGRTFYEQQQTHLGLYFWDSLLADIESLMVSGGIHNRIEGYYRLLSQRFPYAIYYQVQADTLDVIAVLPLRRDPTWLAGVLNERST
ncbi:MULTISPECIES: type II toxin-antitoxin system RelE/ParE family toxin [Thiorhodovibrio]|uniref:type II toxin-antitoxin system RelE/ParE family toxin n=1 Tax=Thiorhodovibrio TaxID=61593 RepID=UPI00191401EC|nr:MULTISPECIES: type II toxin-antitoxin system RelE/ParE family toxin [Thiorhodovibrio]MBK5968533.1 hypothetical protein [Thiorhodovibrio winogradskyi]WPL12433.1 hypothetical protein Thiosp_02197 [Thiorhodovibrio litoralis]